MGFYVRFKILRVLNNAGENELHAGLPGDFNALSRSFIRVNAAEKEQVISMIGSKRELTQVDPVMDGGDVVKLRAFIRLADGHVISLLVVLFIHGKNIGR